VLITGSCVLIKLSDAGIKALSDTAVSNKSSLRLIVSVKNTAGINKRKAIFDFCAIILFWVLLKASALNYAIFR